MVYTRKIFNKITRQTHLESVKVKVLEETTKSLKVQLLGLIDGHRYGDVIWVRRGSVALPKPEPDYTAAWWNE